MNVVAKVSSDKSANVLSELAVAKSLKRTPQEASIASTPIDKRISGTMLSVCRLTPELSRTAARNGGVVHVTMQPSREAVSA